MGVWILNSVYTYKIQEIKISWRILLLNYLKNPRHVKRTIVPICSFDISWISSWVPTLHFREINGSLRESIIAFDSLKMSREGVSLWHRLFNSAEYNVPISLSNSTSETYLSRDWKKRMTVELRIKKVVMDAIPA